MNKGTTSSKINHFFKFIFAGCFFVFSFCLSSVSIGFYHPNSYETLSKEFDDYKKENSQQFVYSQVSSSSKADSFSSFFYYADDDAGSETKQSTDTFFFSKQTGSFSPLTIQLADETIGFSSFQYTSWSFNKYHYDFELASGTSVKNLEKGEAYITDCLANEIGASSGDSIEINNANNTHFLFVIVGVIRTDIKNKIFENNLLDTRFLVTKYYDYQQLASSKCYCFYLNKGYVSTLYSLRRIEGAIERLSDESTSYSSTYFDFNKQTSSFVTDKLQKKKNSIFSSKIALMPAVIFLIISISLLFSGAVFSRANHFSVHVSVLVLIISFLLSEIVLSILPIFHFFGFFLDPYSTNGGIFSLLVLVLSLISTILWKYLVPNRLLKYKNVRHSCCHI